MKALHSPMAGAQPAFSIIAHRIAISLLVLAAGFTVAQRCVGTPFEFENTGSLANERAMQTRTPTGSPSCTPMQYVITLGTAQIVPGTIDIGNHTDDGDTFISLPFPFTLYSDTYNSVNVSSNGRLDFVCVNEPLGSETACLPAPANQCSYDQTIFGVWKDMRTDFGLSGCSHFPGGNCGIFTSVTGSTPDRIFNIEWRTVLFIAPSQPENFEVRLYENPALNQRFDVIFGRIARYCPIGCIDDGYAWVSGVQGLNSVFTQDFCIIDGTLPQNVSRTYTIPCGEPQPNPVPLINQPLVPDAVAPGGRSFTLTVNGTGFVSGSVVNWNGNARATTFVSNSQLTASILASDIATASTASIAVVNPSPGGGPSNVVYFPITFPSSSVAFRRKDFPVPMGPATCATGDFNRDGKLDLAVATEDGMSVSILLGKGNGSFLPAVDYALSERLRWILTADFNGDGKLDLAAGGETSNVISILLGNGDGTFQTPVTYSTGAGPFWVVAADFNGDGKLDLASANFIDNTVSVLLGQGDGTFQSHMDFPTGVGPFWVVTGDFNGDNQLDLATADWFGNTISVLLGNGDGTFEQNVDYAESTNPRSMVTADLNGDGKLDFAIANEGSGTVGIMLGNGDGSFQNPVYYRVKGGPVWIGAADMSGHGTVDLLVSDYSQGTGTTVTFLKGVGDGTFPRRFSYPVGIAPQSSAIGDFNDDGRLDLAAPASGDDAVSILLQR